MGRKGAVRWKYWQFPQTRKSSNENSVLRRILNGFLPAMQAFSAAASAATAAPTAESAALTAKTASLPAKTASLPAKSAPSAATIATTSTAAPFLHVAEELHAATHFLAGVLVAAAAV